MAEESIKIERGSERNFGITFGVIFVLFGLYRLWSVGDILWWTFISASVISLISLLRPGWLTVPNHLWFKFGLLLGRIISPIVMGLVYVTTVIPMGIIIRLTGKDLLQLKLGKDRDSYWIKRDDAPQPMKNQF